MGKRKDLFAAISKTLLLAIVIVGVVAVIVAIYSYNKFSSSAPQPTTTFIPTPTATTISPLATTTSVLQSLTQTVTRVPVQKITIITTTEAEDPLRWAAVQAIANEWRKLGFDVEVIGLEGSQVDKTCYYQWNFDVCVFGWGARVDRLDPKLFLGLIITDEIGKKGEGRNNPTGYSNPEYDQLYKQFISTMDIQKRRELAFKLQEIFHEDVPRYNIYHSMILVAYNSEKWSNPYQMPGQPLLNEWQPHYITPLTNDTTLVYGSVSEPDSLNPLRASIFYSWQILKFIYDSLVRLGSDGKPIPWMAESINIINDTTIEVKLRQGMVFHDGKPITADDVVFTFKYFLEKKQPVLSQYLISLSDVVKKDDYTVVFYLKYPDAAFLTTTLYMVPILPKHIWENITDPSSLTEDQLQKIIKVGSGEFMNPIWVKKEYISLEVFPKHFAYNGIKIGDLIVPPIKVSKILIKYYGNIDGIVNALIRKEIDMTSAGLLPAHVDLLQQYSYIKIIKARSFALSADLMFNLRRSPFDLKEVRQALLYAIPYDYIINVIYKGYAEKGYIIAPVNSFWHNPNVKDYEYNLTKARELLAKAGFIWDQNGKIYYPVNYVIKKQEDP
ncbi:MAG: ABC transporter substrate-binding protein [Sulfolobales archaeon]